MLVLFPDGHAEVACCGPRARRLLVEGGIAYRPLEGEGFQGVCCHGEAHRRSYLTGVQAEARDVARLYEALGRMLGR